MHDQPFITRLLTVLVTATLLAPVARVRGDEFVAVEHKRQTVYHSPEKPGFTSWVGAWVMPDGSLMTCFTQATGPLKDRPMAPKEVQEKLNWPPKGSPGYDMTGLDLKNVHLHSTDAGKTWKDASADSFKSCMNGVTGEAEVALPDGTVIRGVFGFYLPYDADLPKTGFVQRSTDGTKTWGKPEVLLDPKKYTAWPRRIRALRDGRVVVLLGVAPLAAGSHTRDELSKKLQPMLVVSSDMGKTWKGPIPAVPKDQPDGWTEEFDVAELAGGDLLAVFRRASDSKRWQSVLKKADDTWEAGTAGASVLPHGGQPELLVTKEGPVLHVATSGVHWTTDAGKTWNVLKVPGSAYYPRSVQTADGRIFLIGHIGGDDAYGVVDQSVVVDSFRLEKKK
jgi:Neuraminidase (sialidase)